MTPKTNKIDQFESFGITQSFLKDRFEYDPEEGKLIFSKNCPPFGVKGASPVFYNPQLGKSFISLKGRNFAAARVIWYLVTGEIPPCQVMVIDGDPNNLKWLNLALISNNPTHLPTHLELNNFFSYNPQTGSCLWVNVPYYVRRVKVGDEVGCLTRGKYKTVSLNGHKKPLTHVIWCSMTGEYPKKDVYIDHIDRNPLNNAWDNLRLASAQENSSNQSSRKDTKRGLLRGVERVRNLERYYARCMYKGVRYRGQPRDTQEEAHQDYVELHKKLHGQYSNYV